MREKNSSEHISSGSKLLNGRYCRNSSIYLLFTSVCIDILHRLGSVRSFISLLTYVEPIFRLPIHRWISLLTNMEYFLCSGLSPLFTYMAYFSIFDALRGEDKLTGCALHFRFTVDICDAYLVHLSTIMGSCR